MDVFEAIGGRTSVRAYLPRAVEKEKIQAVLQAGVRAPSGKNGQPWRFVVLQKDKALLRQIANSATAEFILQADCLIFVFFDKERSYDRIKDNQAIGACVENMLLAAEAYELGACWIGALNGKSDEVKKLLNIESPQYDLAAVLTIGYPAFRKIRSARKSLSEVVLKEL